METSQSKSNHTITNAILHWLKDQQTIVGQKLPINHPFRWCSYWRNREMARSYLKKVANAMEQRLLAKVNLSIILPPMVKARETSSGTGENECVLAQFRVFGEKVSVMIPFELVQDLNSIIQKKYLTPLYLRPGNEELTTLSYLFADVLSDNRLYNQHRIYLTTVGVWSDKLANKIEEAPLPDSKNEEVFLIAIKVNINGYCYTTTVILSRGICERLTVYGKYRPISELGKGILNREVRNCKLIYRLPLYSYLNLLQLDQGEIIKFNYTQEASGEAYLPVVMTQGKVALGLKLLKRSSADKLYCRVE